MNGTKRIRTLTELGLNSPATVARMKLDPKEADRLADLGMRTGVEVRVLQAAPEAPLLVAVLGAFPQNTTKRFSLHVSQRPSRRQ